MSSDDTSTLDYLNQLTNNSEGKMRVTYDVLVKKYTGLRTDRANINMFDSIVVDVYGNKLPVNQLANVSIVDQSRLTITIWDQSITGEVYKTLQNSNLGVSLEVCSSVIKITLPVMTEERRKEIIKIAEKYAEESKISIRNVRRDVNSKIKKAVDNISLDEQSMFLNKIQKITDQYIGYIDVLLTKKSKEIIG